MSRLRLTAVVLLVVGAGLFAVGTTVERSRHHDEPAAGSDSGASHDEAGESAEHREAEDAEGHSEAADSDEGKVLGVDRESTGLVVLAVFVSVALAGLLWRRPSPAVWLVAALGALAFAFFDVAEVMHQADESSAGLAALATAVAIAHAGTVVTATIALRVHPLP